MHTRMDSKRSERFVRIAHNTTVLTLFCAKAALKRPSGRLQATTTKKYLLYIAQSCQQSEGWSYLGPVNGNDEEQQVLFTTTGSKDWHGIERETAV